MGNTPARRPSTARKNTRTTQEKRQAEEDQGVRLTYDGETYDLRAGDLTSLDAFAMRRELGMTFAQLMEAMNESPDIDLVAAVIWLSRRTRGERTLRFATVAETVTYESVDELLELDEDTPESPGESQPAGD